MKKLILIYILLCYINNISAQSDSHVTTKTVDNLLYYLDIPKKYHLKDKIIFINNSNYYIGLVSIAICENGQFIPLGSNTGLIPGKEYDIVSYKNNELKTLRKKKIAIKLKGFKSILSNQDSEFININSNELKIRASENRHDLVIEVFNSLF